MPEQWKRDNIERSRQHLLRRMASQAENKMRERTAHEELAAHFQNSQRGPDDVVPDADDGSMRRTGVLT